MNNKFVFYDLETSGLSSEFDQVLQFAAIVVDQDFNELERVDLRCRLSPHILPNPIALAVTGVMPEKFIDSSLPSELELAQSIRAFAEKWAPAIWTGYNSLKFDESHLRQMFYQTLQPNIYETQFNGNTRLDILLVTQACRLNAPEALKWPVKSNNKVSFKLDMLAPANGFVDHNAHDALGDVEATIHLAKLMAEKAPEVWNGALKNRQKNHVISTLKKFEPVNLITSHYGNVSQKTYCFCCLDGNSAALFNVEEYDPEAFFNTSDQELTELISKGSELIKIIAVNQVPNISKADASEEIGQRCKAVKNNRDFQKRLLNVVEKRYDDQDKPDDALVEKKIYEGFYSNGDKLLLQQFQTSSWEERKQIIGKFSDVRLKQLGRRLLVFHGDVELNEAYTQGAVKYLKDKWLNSQSADWATFESIESDLKKVEDQAMIPEEQVAKLRAFYSDIRQSITANEIPFHSR